MRWFIVKKVEKALGYLLLKHGLRQASGALK